MSKRTSNVDPVSGRPLSGWEALINRPRGEAAKAAIGKVASYGKPVTPSGKPVASSRKPVAPSAKPVPKKVEIPDGYRLVYSIPQGPLSWVMIMKYDPW
jgi:hypothetical protein